MRDFPTSTPITMIHLTNGKLHIRHSHMYSHSRVSMISLDATIDGWPVFLMILVALGTLTKWPKKNTKGRLHSGSWEMPASLHLLAFLLFPLDCIDSIGRRQKPGTPLELTTHCRRHVSATSCSWTVCQYCHLRLVASERLNQKHRTTFFCKNKSGCISNLSQWNIELSRTY